MSNENLSRLISSSKICYLPYPYFKIAEIQMHLIFSVYAYYNNVCVCVCVSHCYSLGDTFAKGRQLCSSRSQTPCFTH